MSSIPVRIVVQQTGRRRGGVVWCGGRSVAEEKTRRVAAMEKTDYEMAGGGEWLICRRQSLQNKASEAGPERILLDC